MSDELAKALQSYMEAVKEYNNTVEKLSKQVKEFMESIDIEKQYREKYEYYYNLLVSSNKFDRAKSKLAKIDCSVEYEENGKNVFVTITDDLEMPYQYCCLLGEDGEVIAINF